MALSLQRYMSLGVDFNANSLIKLLKERSKKDRERSTRIVTFQNGDCLHECLIGEILSWLPVKDLLQHKSVCKSWYAIISSPDFISKHLKNYYRNNNDWRGCLLTQYYLTHAELQVIAMLMNEIPRVVAHEKLYDIPMYASSVYGPCDGLYCLYDDFGKYAFWNPAINELKVLPPIASHNRHLYSDEDVGFGFDEVNRDYKMVAIKRHKSAATGELLYDPQSVFVYSLRNDSWRHCGELRRYYRLIFNKCDNFVNGCCYWIETSHMYRDNICDSIISFDMSTDVFKDIKLPFLTQSPTLRIGIYDDSLALLSLGDDKWLEIWTLNARIWCMKSKMGPFLDILHPVGHWKDNLIILESEDHNLVLLDPESQDIKYLSFRHATFCQRVFVYMESLVSIKDDNCGQDEDHNVMNYARLSISSSESDTEYGIDQLFRCETS